MLLLPSTQESESTTLVGLVNERHAKAQPQLGKH